MSYRRYLAHSENALRHYLIHKEIFISDSITLLKAKHKIYTEKQYIIRIEKFNLTSDSIARFETLMRAFQQGIICAEEIYLEEMIDHHQVVVIEPSTKIDSQTTKAEPLARLLKRGSLSYP